MCIYIVINDNNVITNPWWKYTLSTPKQKYSSFWAHHCIADLATLVAIGSATAKRKPCGFFFDTHTEVLLNEKMHICFLLIIKKNIICACKSASITVQPFPNQKTSKNVDSLAAESTRCFPPGPEWPNQQEIREAQLDRISFR